MRVVVCTHSIVRELYRTLLRSAGRNFRGTLFVQLSLCGPPSMTVQQLANAIMEMAVMNVAPSACSHDQNSKNVCIVKSQCPTIMTSFPVYPDNKYHINIVNKHMKAARQCASGGCSSAITRVSIGSKASGKHASSIRNGVLQILHCECGIWICMARKHRA